MTLRALYGVAGLGPTQLARYLTRVSGGCALILENKLHKTGPLPEVPSVVFSSLNQFLKHNARVTKTHIAFVIDAPERLTQVHGLLGLGFTKSTRNNWFAYTALKDEELRMCLTEARNKGAKVEWEYRPVNPIQELIQDDTTDNVLNKIRSLLYSVPNKETRAYVTDKVYRYLANEVKIGALESATPGLGPKTQARLCALLRSADCVTLREAYAGYKVRPSKASKICKTYKVSMFVLRYIETKVKKVAATQAKARH